MIEPIMYLTIGFLVAVLCGLMVVPLVHGRAVRLTTRRLEAAAPLSMAEIQADKDHMRAEFAMAARRLEINIERLRNKSTGQAAEIGRKTEALQRLRLEIDEQRETIGKLESGEAELRDTLRKTETDLAATIEKLTLAEQTILDGQATVQTLKSDVNSANMTAESKQVELIAKGTQIDLLKGAIIEAEAKATSLRDDLSEKTSIAERLAAELADAKTLSGNLAQRVAEMDQLLAAEITARDQLSARTKTLEAEFEARNAIATRLEADTAKYVKQATDAETAARELRLQVTALSSGRQLPIDHLQASKTKAQENLRKAVDENALLKQEIRDLKDRLGAEATAERAENAKLRERINEIAAEVAHLAMNLEGPDATIGEILAADAQSAIPATHVTLADRIRALQARADHR